MDDQSNQISRRKLLKRLGAGTAVVWSAPVLSSITTPAFGQTPADCFPTFCGPRYEFCGEPGVACPLPPECSVGICSLLNDNSCLCWDLAVCTCPNPICQSDADCGGGGRCGPTEPDCELCCGRVACFYDCRLAGSAPRGGRGVVVRRASDFAR